VYRDALRIQFGGVAEAVNSVEVRPDLRTCAVGVLTLASFKYDLQKGSEKVN